MAKNEQASDSKVLFFPVGTVKLFIMSAVTLGIYEFYWFFKNWWIIRERTGRDLRAFWRAFFGIFYCYPLFKEMAKESRSHKVLFPASPGPLALLWVFLSAAGRLPDPYWTIALLSPLVLIPIQKTINRLNTIAAPDHDPNTRYSKWNIFGIVVGGICFVLAIIGTIFPDTGAVNE